MSGPSNTWRERIWRRAGLHKLGLKMHEYERYLETPHWQSFRKLALESQLKKLGKNRCENCTTDSRDLHVHHRTYERLGCERIEDVTIVCRQCHEKIHLRDKDPRRGYSPGYR